jgi:trigger factor
MNIVFDKTSNTTADLTVEIVAADYQAAADKELKQIKKTAFLKGFRPGMVPMSYLQKLYGKGVKVQIVNKTVSDAVGDYIRDNSIKIVGRVEPKPENDLVTFEEADLSFGFEVGMVGDFEVDLSGVSMPTFYEIEVREEVIEKALGDFRKANSTSEQAQEVSSGDFTFGQLTQESTEFTHMVGIPVNEKLTPAATEILIGVPVNTEVTLDIQQIFNDPKDLKTALFLGEDKKSSDLEGLFQYKISYISHTKEVELTQELFDKNFGEGQVTNEEELRSRLVAQVKENYDREANVVMNTQIRQLILENIPVELPEAFIKKNLMTRNDDTTEESIDENYPKVAEMFSWDFIKAEIANQAEIKVETEEILAKTREIIISYYGHVPNDIENLARNFLFGQKDQEQSYERYMDIYQRVQEDKVFGYLAEKIGKITEPIQLEAFEEILAKTQEANR